MTTNTEQNTQDTNTNTANVKTVFTVENPHKVELSNTNKGTTITEIATKSGLVIERGHTLKLTQARRNLDDVFANLQVGDVIPIATMKEAVSLVNCMRYRGWKGSMGKQGNGTYKVQRIA